MTKKNVSWPLFTVIGALGLGAALLGPACTVSSGDDDDLDVDAGAGGSTGGSSGGSKATGGSAGASTGGSSGGSAGASTGGSAGTGTGGSSGGSAGAAQMLACLDDTVIPLTVCAPEDQEAGSCNECMETKCCEEWKVCAAFDETAGDFVCAFGGEDGTGEIGCIVGCMREGTMTIEECAGMCPAGEPCSAGTITVATSDLIACMTAEATTCEAACWP